MQLGIDVVRKQPLLDTCVCVDIIYRRRHMEYTIHRVAPNAARHGANDDLGPDNWLSDSSS
jgi:hypothetical protein